MLLYEEDRTITLVFRKHLWCLAPGEGLSEKEETKILRLSFYSRSFQITSYRAVFLNVREELIRWTTD